MHVSLLSIDLFGTIYNVCTFLAGIYTDEQVAGWKKVVDAVHALNGLMYIQLWHIGRVAHPLLQNGHPNVAPSAIAAKGGKFRQLEGEPGYVTPVAIDDPEHYIALYKRAAQRAKEAGFDGVELHRYVISFVLSVVQMKCSPYSTVQVVICQISFLIIQRIIERINGVDLLRIAVDFHYV